MRLLRLPGVFAPIGDSWMLASLVRGQPLGPDSAALDLCTGSGVVAVSAALAGAGEVVAADICRRALICARLNAALNGVRLQARRGDLFEAVAGRRFDLISANPPYVPGPAPPRRGPQRAWEGGWRGRELIERICAGAAGHLRPSGVVLLVHSSICGERETVGALRAVGLDAEVVARQPGGLGPLMRGRADWLRRQGLLGEDEHEELIVVRGQAPASYEATSGVTAQPSRTLAADGL